VGGPPGVDIELLKRHTNYDGFSASDPTIKRFWKVLESFSNEERSMYAATTNTQQHTTQSLRYPVCVGIGGHVTVCCFSSVWL
jgi:hypothetical protein